MYAEIKAKVNKETSSGTLLHVLIPNVSATDYLKKYTGSDTLIGELRIDDGRTIRADQRKKAWAILHDIEDWNGDDAETNHWWLKREYRRKSGESKFSLSNCSVTTARHYISFLLDFCLSWDVPLSESLLNRTDDINAALYATLMNKKCIVCGHDGELHHVDVVGMGRSRLEICHIGMSVMCLCRKHHSEAHLSGKDTFNSRYHIYGINANQEICDTWRLNTDRKTDGS